MLKGTWFIWPKEKKTPTLGECGVFVADNKGLNRHAQSRKTVVITAKQ